MKAHLSPKVNNPFDPKLFGKPLSPEEAIKLLSKHIDGNKQDLHSSRTVDNGQPRNAIAAIDYFRPRVAYFFEKTFDKIYRFFSKIFGKSKISKLTSQLEPSQEDIKKWTEGAKNFEIFWKGREANPETDLFQSLFLNERPMLVLNKLNEDDIQKLKEQGFEVIDKGDLGYNNCGIKGGHYVLNKSLLEQVMQQHPDLYGSFANCEALIDYISSSISTTAPENEITEYCLRTGLALGYPLEACVGFAKLCGLQRETEIKAIKFGVMAIPNESLDFAIRHFCQLARTEQDPTKKQLAGDIVELLKKQAALLLNAYKNLAKIATYGANWMPFGDISNETNEKVNRLSAAFSRSNIKGIFSKTFAEAVFDRRFHNIRKLESALLYKI